MTASSPLPRLHLITDDRCLARGDFLQDAARLVEVGGDQIAFHLRGPRTTGRRLWEIGRELLPAVRGTGALLLINDRVDVALALRSDGVHLGSRSLHPSKARAIAGSEAIIGRSVHGMDEARQVADEIVGEGRIDYVLAGTLYQTPTHPGREGQGPDSIKDVLAELGELPVLGIGGITADKVHPVFASGGYGIAVIRAVWEADDPPGALELLLGQIESAVDESGGNSE